jgi:hypothetical protein
MFPQPPLPILPPPAIPALAAARPWPPPPVPDVRHRHGRLGVRLAPRRSDGLRLTTNREESPPRRHLAEPCPFPNKREKLPSKRQATQEQDNIVHVSKQKLASCHYDIIWVYNIRQTPHTQDGGDLSLYRPDTTWSTSNTIQDHIQLYISNTRPQSQVD